jgi:hypothetical protein
MGNGGDRSEERSGDGWSSIVTTRVTIDRLTGTAREQRLFTSEAAPRQLTGRLGGRLRARHPAGVLTQDDDGFPYEYSLLVAALCGLDALGGEKGTGRGSCRVEIPDGGLRWNGRGITIQAAEKAFDEPDWGEMMQLLREEMGSQ